MKNLLKSLFLAASVCVLLAGCSGLGIGDATVSSDSAAKGYGWLTINVDDFQGYRVAGRSVGRTITPVSLTDESNTLTKFVLKGKSTITGASLLDEDDNDGITLTFTDADSDPDTPDVASAQIPFGAWDLTLEAYQGDVVVLQGRTYVDLKTPKTSVAFTLTTDNLTTAGSVDLAGSFTDADNVVTKYTAGLYSLTDGNLKYPAALSEVTLASTAAREFAFAQTGVLPGRYSFQVRFYNGTNQVGFWEDVVVVAPGRETKDTEISCGNIIMQLPNSPEDLTAYIVDDSEDENGNYTVLLKWTDNSNNEENFVVTIEEYKGVDATAEKYAVLGVEDKSSEKEEIFWSSAKNAGGSVRTSSEECMIKLPLGHIFDVSIQAQNFVGLSKVSNTVARCARGTTKDAVTGTTKITTTHINRMAVKYDLNNGTLTLADGSVKTGTYTIYKSIYDEGISEKTPATLIDIDNDDAAKNHLVSGRYPFAAWSYTDPGDTTPNTMKALTYMGTEVKASYDKSTNITYTVDNTYYTISATAKYGNTENVQNTSFDAKANSNITFDVTAKKRVKRLIANSDPAAYEYVEETVTGKTVDWMRVSITNLPGDPIDSGKVSGASYTFDGTNGLMSGPHTVTVKAHFAGEPAGTIYEFTFALGLER